MLTQLTFNVKIFTIINLSKLSPPLPPFPPPPQTPPPPPPPRIKKGQQNCYAWITFPLGYTHTKFCFDQVSGFWDMQTIKF